MATDRRIEAGIFNRQEAADYLGLSYSTLAAWASVKGGGPALIKAGSRVLYLKADLDSWLEKQRVPR